MSQPHSLAFTTGTRVDSAAKHIMACKIDSQLMKAYAGNPNATLEDLHHAKLDFITEKDDLVVNVCQKLFKSNESAYHAYPPVISHMGKSTGHLRFFLKVLYSLEGHGIWDVINYCRSAGGGDEVSKILGIYNEIMNNSIPSTIPRTDINDEITKLNGAGYNRRTLNLELQETPFFQIQGYSLGRAFGSSLSGDTVFSVLIGGCATVINGHFPMYTGQLVQWYFGFENEQFHYDNRYQAAGAGSHVLGSRMIRQGGPAISSNILAKKKRKLEEPKREEQGFIFPKAFVPNGYGSYHLPDRMRIFAKCINGGGPFEPVDIMIMTQSL
jgi:hypothetical protein